MTSKLEVPVKDEKVEDSLYNLIITDEKELRKICHETTEAEVKEKKIVECMKMAIDCAWVNGFGLAAIQVGFPVRMAWFRRPEYIGRKLMMGDDIVLINPVIVKMEKPFIYTNEGCLSLPPINGLNRLFNTKRYQEVTVTMDSFDTTTKELLGKEANNGAFYTFRGLEAVICLHELDHFEGILCSDREYKAKEKVGRNDPCPCKSGKKSKKCCFK